MEELRTSAESLKPTSENLTAILTCIGVVATEETQSAVLQCQNPYGQKRGGLGFGGYAVVDVPGAGRSFVNVNLYNRIASRSPLGIRIKDPTSGSFDLVYDGEMYTTGTFLGVPEWGKRTLSTGKPAITVLQQHGPRNLVGVIGQTRCPLFDAGRACRFCSMDGRESNVERTVEEITEAFTLARSEGRSSYTLTLTTALFDVQGFLSIVGACRAIKHQFPDAALALEVQPLQESEIESLSEAGVDTLMVPLDCASEEAQDRYVPGKKPLLRERYWHTMPEAVRRFGPGNVTSSIIVGLEDARFTEEAIRRMVEMGVVPEPIPVRWDESMLSDQGDLPVTDPRLLVAIRHFLVEELVRSGLSRTMAQTRAGCAACGGCSGIVVNQLRDPLSRDPSRGAGGAGAVPASPPPHERGLFLRRSQERENAPQ